MQSATPAVSLSSYRLLLFDLDGTDVELIAAPSNPSRPHHCRSRWPDHRLVSDHSFINHRDHIATFTEEP